MSDLGVGSTVPLRQLGRLMLEWRNRSGLSQARAAELLEMGATSLARIEKAEITRVRTSTVKEACGVYGVPADVTEGMVRLAQQAKVKSWWHSYSDLLPKNLDVYVGLEAAAAECVTYQPELIPGLLQTENYDRALLSERWPNDPAEERDRRTQIKQHRQAAITRKHRPLELDVVIGQAVLHRPVGGAKVMASQLRHLADSSTRENVSIRVLPFEAGFPGGISMLPFVILDFGTPPRGEPTEPPVVYLEGDVGSMYLESEDDVRFYTDAHNTLREAALEDSASRDLLRRIAREYSS
ncbi:helix-turn-helix domain-containing protein [Nocardia sp. ET3-3]|uniref:Helix-turn-helix domain-containing protein n=1 Tax=Nocardia terrae TaxID=2675851 RepID=A0A7K1UX92_9NOCA|nr:helix-turn-helix transcriptional regulator [Nocardia terrae]MVU78847.1 helix-turn-helix domain-containing protein [Nocardia terrae]